MCGQRAVGRTRVGTMSAGRGRGSAHTLAPAELSRSVTQHHAAATARLAMTLLLLLLPLLSLLTLLTLLRAAMPASRIPVKAASVWPDKTTKDSPKRSAKKRPTEKSPAEKGRPRAETEDILIKRKECPAVGDKSVVETPSPTKNLETQQSKKENSQLLKENAQKERNKLLAEKEVSPEQDKQHKIQETPSDMIIMQVNGSGKKLTRQVSKEKVVKSNLINRECKSLGSVDKPKQCSPKITTPFSEQMKSSRSPSENGHRISSKNSYTPDGKTTSLKSDKIPNSDSQLQRVPSSVCRESEKSAVIVKRSASEKSVRTTGKVFSVSTRSPLSRTSCTLVFMTPSPQVALVERVPRAPPPVPPVPTPPPAQLPSSDLLECLTAVSMEGSPYGLFIGAVYVNSGKQVADRRFRTECQVALLNLITTVQFKSHNSDRVYRLC